MQHHRTDRGGQRYGRSGGQGIPGIARADLPRGHCAVAAHQDDGRHGDVADGGITDLPGAQDRAKQGWRETPGWSARSKARPKTEKGSAQIHVTTASPFQITSRLIGLSHDMSDEPKTTDPRADCSDA